MNNIEVKIMVCIDFLAILANRTSKIRYSPINGINIVL